MPHRLGHHLGLDVHDLTALLGSISLGVYGDDGLEQPLSPGSVITVEPGIYLPSESLGVRLEDDYLVTETGLERLGPAPPHRNRRVRSDYAVLILPNPRPLP